MEFQSFKSSLVRAGLALAALLLASTGAQAQQVINLTAAPTTTTMADGSVVPMWGYFCGPTAATATASCAALNPGSVTTAASASSAAAGTWSPVVITVPYAGSGTSLTINLTNNLVFATASGTNALPTSLTIVGQLGGGLGTAATRAASPVHQDLGVSWDVAGTPGANSPTFVPPPQPQRVQSFAQEVAPSGSTPATGQVASGSALTWSNLRPGTYLIESGTHPSIQGTMGLYGVLVVTTPPTATGPGTAYPAGAVGNSPAVPYSAEVPILLGEIDPVQNAAVAAAVSTPGFSETLVWSGQPGGCGNPASSTYQTCYPPVVNYTPTYFTINGVGFNRSNPAASVFPILSNGNTGTGNGLLVRLVNAGSRMHVPMIVGAQTTVGTNTPAGMTLVAEDGNPLPGQARVQSEVFMAAGKTYDVLVNVPTTALPIYDRELSLSGNQTDRDAGMLAYLSPGTAATTALTGALAGSGVSAAAAAVADSYPVLVAGQPFTLSDPSKGVIANDINVYGVTLLSNASHGNVTLNRNGTFTYTPNAGSTATSDSFSYCANTAAGATCPSGLSATVTLAASAITSAGVKCTAQTYTAATSAWIAIKAPGLLSGCTDGAGLPLSVVTTSLAPASGLSANADVYGGFTATLAQGSLTGGTYTLTATVQNSLGQTATQTATVVFPKGSGLQVSVIDPNAPQFPIGDYRWIIEEDRTFYINPKCVQNPPPAGVGCPDGSTIVPTLGVNFHTSYMPFVAQGCTGPLSCESGQTVLGAPAVCDVGNGNCRPGTAKTVVMPGQVALDPTKRYFLSILPGDAANPFPGGYAAAPCTYDGSNTQTCLGHGMGGAPIGIDPNTLKQATSVTVWTQPSPYQTAQLSIFVFEDDFPLNGEHDGGGGADVLAPNEPGLGGFEVVLWDAMGGNGDFTGQMTHDMFNQPLGNALAGTIDPTTGLDACPISKNESIVNGNTAGITGRIVTCPTYESNGTTLSPLAGQALIKNLMPMRVGVIATPAADRIARGEEWLQTNTLDGQKAHDAFAKIGEPAYFQEFGPANYHVSIGFANPKIINGRLKYVCNGTDANAPTPGTVYQCNNTLTGKITGERLSRTPDERLYSSGSHDTYYWTQCYVSVGDPDGEDFAFTKCNPDGTFTLTGLPPGDWRVTSFDQWNDQLVDGLSTPVRLGGVSCGTAGASPVTCNPSPTPNNVNMEIAATQWETNLYTKTFIDDEERGVASASSTGIPFANVAVRLRDGSLENLLLADFSGTANFNETFPLFSWYVVETDVTRYKNTGTHVIYDAGGPADNSAACGTPGYPPCGVPNPITNFLANSAEQLSLPTSLRVPGSVYCAVADCTSGAAGPKSIQNGPASSDPPSACSTTTSGATSCTTLLSTGRIDNPWLGGIEGWQGFPGQNNFLEFGKAPYAAGENGGIQGHVVYASTRPFDDPQMLVQVQWEPLLPHVTINLYQEGVGADGVTPTLTLVDTTQTSSWDDWAQGFHLAADGVTQVPNMNCPGQGAAANQGLTGSSVIPDLFFFSLYNQPNYLDLYNNVLHGSASAPTALPYNAQFKCYDGMHNWNQIQPAPYDGVYHFPSITATDPTTGKPTATNCKICTTDPATDLYSGVPMLPPGKYVVEVVVPPGMELVKEEDKNILIGDNFIAPAVQEFGGLANLFILPDQASIAGSFSSGSGYNANNAQNPTQSLGATAQNGLVPGFTPEPTWPCVGELRTVPDYISLFPQTRQVAPFAGASRHLCDRKEVVLNDQMHVTAKFYLYTSAHMASKFTGGITDDYTSEFDPFSPQFGEKFSPPDMPVSVKDWTGAEVNRIYADHWGSYDGMTYSTWEVNPPNPTGYAPSMMVMCMNDPGPITDTNPSSATFGQQITDPLFSQGYSQFCYELPFMPGTTQYLDTPVVPTSAFAGAGYNNPDCYEPDATPAIKEVDGDGVGPWIAAKGSAHPITITALGNLAVPNYAYSGPAANTAPFNQKTTNRHYGFGATQGSGSVSIGGVAATVSSWSDTSITAYLPTGANVPACAIQQQARYGGSNALCGQIVITTAAGQQSVETVTLTIGGKKPTHVAATASVQQAIDAAAPGDLLIIDPTCANPTAAGTALACTVSGASLRSTAAHNELLLMWKPVRLQGVGANSSIINANTQPAGKLTPWRASVDCLFGLSMNGQPNPAPTGLANPFDPTNTYNCPNGLGGSGAPSATGVAGVGPDGYNWAYFNPNAFNAQVDLIPFEAALGWDASLSGNLAELLQEPTLMGALEGAGVTVLSKGVAFLSNPRDPTLQEGAFPADTVLFVEGNTHSYCNGVYPSNFWCNPSSIDGLGITDSSQGGGGVFIHAWSHNLQIANNRIYNNSGTLSGGINLGQGEYPPSYIQGGADNEAPGSCETSGVNGQQLPYCLDVNVNMHHNWVSLNNSTGDELFSATPAGAGGVSVTTGADYYAFTYNWVCGNLSSGDGGGFGHLGFIKNGDIEHNTIIFNQSTNPTITTNGGGLVIMGAPDSDPTCGATTDQDCVSALGTVGPSDGVGPGLVINANLIQGNAAESGSGGGIAFESVNGSDVVAFPTKPGQWHHITLTNNIIVNNVAGWDGGGISLLDALNMDIVNNTISSNVTTATAGVLTNTLGAPLASTQNCPPGATNAAGLCTVSIATSTPQPAGLVSVNNSAVLLSNLPAIIVCPANHYAPGTSAVNGACRQASYPELDNNLIWQNAAYYIGVGNFTAQYQQNTVQLYNAFTTTVAGSQGATGQCVPGTNYWDIGVRGDTGPGIHSSGVVLAPNYSLLTSALEVGAGANNLGGYNPLVTSQYCNGSRQPPEACAGVTACGWSVPPGIADATAPNPIFNLTPVATVDEGNNWVNMRWGPLALTNPSTAGADGNYGGGAALGNYVQTSASPVNNWVPNSAGTAYNVAPTSDFYGHARKQNGAAVDVGAVQLANNTLGAILVVTPNALNFPATINTFTSAAQTLTLRNDGSVAATGIAVAVTAPFSRPAASPGSCGTTLAAGANCTINVVFSPTAATSYTGTATLTATNATVDGSPVALSGTGQAATPAALVSTAAVNFGSWRTGTSSSPVTLTVSNVGNVALTGGAFTFSTGTGTPFTRVGGSCGANLGIGANCTITVRFTAPASTGVSSRTLTVAYGSAAGAAAVSNSPVALTGTSVSTAATLSLSAPGFTLAPGVLTGSGTVTVTNTSTTTSASITNDSVTGAGLIWVFSKGADSCSGGNLAPGASCTVGVNVLRVTAPLGTHNATITFTDNATASPQTVTLPVLFQ